MRHEPLQLLNERRARERLARFAPEFAPGADLDALARAYPVECGQASDDSAARWIRYLLATRPDLRRSPRYSADWSAGLPPAPAPPPATAQPPREDPPTYTDLYHHRGKDKEPRHA